MMADVAQFLTGGTLLLLLILMVRTPVAHAFGAQWAYRLWLVPLIHAGVALMSAAGQGAPLVSQGVQIPLPTVTTGGGSSWWPMLAFTWIAGVGVFGSWQLLSYRSLLRSLGSTGSGSAWRAGTSVIFSSAVRGPLAVGLLRPLIVLPADFDQRYAPFERRLVLDHEFVHVQRGDVWWNAAALFLLALHWFNPIAYIAFLAYRADQEISCDAEVAAGMSSEQRYEYAMALVKSATSAAPLVACALNRKADLTRRLRMLKRHSGRDVALGAGAAFCAMLVIGVAFASSISFAGPPLGRVAGMSSPAVANCPKGAIGKPELVNGKEVQSIDCVAPPAAVGNSHRHGQARTLTPPRVERVDISDLNRR